MNKKRNFSSPSDSSTIQLNLFPEFDSVSKTKIEQFSSEEICDETQRKNLEDKYYYLLQETNEYNRKIVSFQANKQNALHSWFHYKEGFSSQLVESFIKKLGIQAGDTILEPFCGSGTSLLVAKQFNINAIGFDIFPLCSLIWEVKSNIEQYDLEELDLFYQSLSHLEPQESELKFPNLKITQFAFSEETEQNLMFYRQWIETIEGSDLTKKLFQFILVSILEEISYTRKDGQCLRWDYRSLKIQRRNELRQQQGKKIAKSFNKGNLPTVKDAILTHLSKIIEDISFLQKNQSLVNSSQQQFILESVLEALPKIQSNHFAGVITSPPYCNRYDYSRIYALELAYLGIDEDQIRHLRQTQLSCTVENKSKLDRLQKLYQSLNQEERFKAILKYITENKSFQEINKALLTRLNRKEINNKGVLPMVKQYFIELAFVIAEIYRTCRSKGYIVLVNDNVKYGGEIIPVDTLSTEIAESFGFMPIAIYTLPQLKGNSSQQMDKYGRTALRKSITVWQKP